MHGDWRARVCALTSADEPAISPPYMCYGTRIIIIIIVRERASNGRSVEPNACPSKKRLIKNKPPTTAASAMLDWAELNEEIPCKFLLHSSAASVSSISCFCAWFATAGRVESWWAVYKAYGRWSTCHCHRVWPPLRWILSVPSFVDSRHAHIYHEHIYTFQFFNWVFFLLLFFFLLSRLWAGLLVQLLRDEGDHSVYLFILFIFLFFACDGITGNEHFYNRICEQVHPVSPAPPDALQA